MTWRTVCTKERSSFPDGARIAGNRIGHGFLLRPRTQHKGQDDGGQERYLFGFGHIGGSAVESHISPKTSEMWGTRVLLRGWFWGLISRVSRSGRSGLAGNTRAGCRLCTQGPAVG